MHQNCIFKCYSEVSWLVTLEFGMKGQVVVLIGNITVELKRNNLWAIYDAIIIVPFQTEIWCIFKVYHCEISYLRAPFVLSFPHQIEHGQTSDDRLGNNGVINLQTIIKISFSSIDGQITEE